MLGAPTATAAAPKQPITEACRPARECSSGTDARADTHTGTAVAAIVDFCGARETAANIYAGGEYGTLSGVAATAATGNARQSEEEGK